MASHSVLASNAEGQAERTPPLGMETVISGSSESGLMQRKRRDRLVLAGLAALLVVALPTVLADHAYSHRYLIYGRVVDSDGNAVRAVTVLVATRHFFPNPEGCRSLEGSRTDAFGKTDTSIVTNEFGEFVYCYHEHAMSRAEPGEATVTVPEVGYSTNITFDPYLRESIVPIVLSAPHPNATHALDTSYTVLGRVWEPHPAGVQLEGNTVFGLTLVDSRVNLTLALPDGTVLTNSTRSNDYGDFAVRFHVPTRVVGGTVTLEASGNYTVRDSAPVDPKTGLTVFQTRLPDAGVAPARGIAKIVAIVIVVLIGTVAALLVARSLLSRRASAAAHRSRSSRRRQNR